MTAETDPPAEETPSPEQIQQERVSEMQRKANQAQKQLNAIRTCRRMYEDLQRDGAHLYLSDKCGKQYGPGDLINRGELTSTVSYMFAAQLERMEAELQAMLEPKDQPL